MLFNNTVRELSPVAKIFTTLQPEYYQTDRASKVAARMPFGKKLGLQRQCDAL